MSDEEQQSSSVDRVKENPPNDDRKGERSNEKQSKLTTQAELISLCTVVVILVITVLNKVSVIDISNVVKDAQNEINNINEQLYELPGPCSGLQVNVCNEVTDCDGGVDEDRCVTIPGGYIEGDIRVYNLEIDQQVGICYDPETWKEDMGITLCQLITNGHYEGSPDVCGEEYSGLGITLTTAEFTLNSLAQSKALFCDKKNSLKIICLPESGSSCSDDFQTNGKITGGEKVENSDYPWQVALRTEDGVVYCGGTFIDGWVITAAHCIKFPDIWDHKIVVGLKTISDIVDDSYKLAITKVRLHPMYNAKTLSHDVAMLKVSEDYAGKGVESATLPAPGQVFPDGSTVIATGWGSSNLTGDISMDLNEVSLELINSEHCRVHSTYDKNNILDGMLCAGETGKDTCKGDDGGPVVDKGSKYLVGITSWGKSCGLDGYPGVYTEVSYVVGWITRTINEIDIAQTTPEQ